MQPSDGGRNSSCTHVYHVTCFIHHASCRAPGPCTPAADDMSAGCFRTWGADHTAWTAQEWGCTRETCKHARAKHALRETAGAALHPLRTVVHDAPGPAKDAPGDGHLCIHPVCLPEVVHVARQQVPDAAGGDAVLDCIWWRAWHGRFGHILVLVHHYHLSKDRNSRSALWRYCTGSFVAPIASQHLGEVERPCLPPCRIAVFSLFFATLQHAAARHNEGHFLCRSAGSWAATA